VTTLSDMPPSAARVSTEDQGNGFSIPMQIEACQKLARPKAMPCQGTPSLSMRVSLGRPWTILDWDASAIWRIAGLSRPLSWMTVTGCLATWRLQLLPAEEFALTGVKVLIVSHLSPTSSLT
jgi:hypothetical protein